MNPNYSFVAARAKHICEYCHAPEAVFNLSFEVEHIIPVSRGGDDAESNLALSCRSCNLYKSDTISHFDEETQQRIRLFHPRQDDWDKYFSIHYTSGEIVALNMIANGTILRLRMNSKVQIKARVQWLKLNLF